MCITCGKKFNTEGENIEICLECQPRLFKIEKENDKKY
jgi:predicted  nucleic acid-binding Zn-ribbon protein